MGGFHLTGASESTILSIIEQLKALGVKKVAPCHCSGDLARKLFKEKFGEDYLEVGVGSDP
jgi:7,8-dihydropterin-6-yl-methyl-4-(beta-D-ribofuranosyl)aminobenzene 5'-phosphate synthase